MSGSEAGPPYERLSPYGWLQTLGGHRLSTFEEFVFFCNSQCKAPYKLSALAKHTIRYVSEDVGRSTHQITISGTLLCSALKHTIIPGTLRDDELASIGEDISREVNKHVDAEAQPGIDVLMAESRRLLSSLRCEKSEESTNLSFNSLELPMDDYDYFQELESVIDPGPLPTQIYTPPHHCIYTPGNEFYPLVRSLSRSLDPDRVSSLAFHLFALNDSDTLIRYDRKPSAHANLSPHEPGYLLRDILLEGFGRTIRPDTASRLLNVYLCLTYMTNDYAHGLEALIRLQELQELQELSAPEIEEGEFEDFLTYSTLLSMELPVAVSIDDGHRLVARLPPLGAHLYRVAFKNILFTSDNGSSNAIAFWTDASFLSRPLVTLSIGPLTLAFLPLQVRVLNDRSEGGTFLVEMPHGERFDLEIFADCPAGEGTALFEKYRRVRVFLNGVEILSRELCAATNLIELAISQAGGADRLHPLSWTLADLSRWRQVLSQSGGPPPIKGLAGLVEAYLVGLHRLSYHYGVLRGAPASLPKILASIAKLLATDPRLGHSLGMLGHDPELRFNSRTSAALLALLNRAAEAPSGDAPVLSLLHALSESQLYELLAQAPAQGVADLLYALCRHGGRVDGLQRVIKFATPKLIATPKLKLPSAPYQFGASCWYDLFQRVTDCAATAGPFYASLVKHAVLHITAALAGPAEHRDEACADELFEAVSQLVAKTLDLSVRLSGGPPDCVVKDLGLTLCTFYLLVVPAARGGSGSAGGDSRLEPPHETQLVRALLSVWNKLVACATHSSSPLSGLCVQLTLHLCDHIRSLSFHPEVPCRLLCGANFVPELAADCPDADLHFMPLFLLALKCIRLVFPPPVVAQQDPRLQHHMLVTQVIPPPPFPQAPQGAGGPAPPVAPAVGPFRREIEEASDQLASAVGAFAYSPELRQVLQRYGMRLLAKVQEVKSRAGSEPPFRLALPGQVVEFGSLSELERYFFDQIGRRCRLASALLAGQTGQGTGSSPVRKRFYRCWRSNSLPCLLEPAFPGGPGAEAAEASPPPAAGPAYAATAGDLTELLDLLVCGPRSEDILRSVYAQQLRSLLLYLAIRSMLALEACDAGAASAATLFRAVAASAVQAINSGCTRGLQPLSAELTESLGLCVSRLFARLSASPGTAASPPVVLFSALLLGPFKDARMTAPLIKQFFVDAPSAACAFPLLWIFLVGRASPGDPAECPHFDVQKAMILGALQYVKAHAASEAAQVEQQAAQLLGVSPQRDGFSTLEFSLALMEELRRIFERVGSLALVRYLFEAILATFAIGPRHTRAVSAKLGTPLSQLLDAAIRRLHFLEPHPLEPAFPGEVGECVRTPARGRGAPAPGAESPSPCAGSVDRVQGEYLFNWLPALGAIPDELLYCGLRGERRCVFGASASGGGFCMAMPHRFHLEERCAAANLVCNKYFLSQGPSARFYPLLAGPAVCVAVSGGLGGIVIFPIPSGFEYPTFQQNFEGVQTSTAAFTICTEGHFGVTVAPADVVLSNVSELFNRNDAVAFVSGGAEDGAFDRYATNVSFSRGDVLEANFALHADTNGQFCLRTELVVAGNSIGSILEVLYDPETQKDPCRRMSLIFIFPTVQALIFDDSAPGPPAGAASLHSSPQEAFPPDTGSYADSHPIGIGGAQSAEIDAGHLSAFMDKIQLYQSILVVDFRLLGSLKDILLQRWMDCEMITGREGREGEVPGWVAVLACDTSKQAWVRVKNLLAIRLASVRVGRDISRLAPLPALPWLSTSSCVSHSPISRLSAAMLTEILRRFTEPAVEWWSHPLLLIVLTLVVKRLTPCMAAPRDCQDPELLAAVADRLYSVPLAAACPPCGGADCHERYHRGDLLCAEATLEDLNLQLLQAIPCHMRRKLTAAHAAHDELAARFLTQALSATCGAGGGGGMAVWRDFTAYCMEWGEEGRRGGEEGLPDFPPPLPGFLERCSAGAPSHCLLPFLLSLPGGRRGRAGELISRRVSALDEQELRALPPELVRVLADADQRVAEIGFGVEDIGALLVESIAASGLEITANFNLKIPRHFERYRIARGLHDLASVWVRSAQGSPPSLEPASSSVTSFRRLALYLAICAGAPGGPSFGEAVGEFALPGFLMDLVLGKGRSCLAGYAWVEPLKMAVDFFTQSTLSVNSDPGSEGESTLVDARLLPADNRLLSELWAGASGSGRQVGVASEYLRANPGLVELVNLRGGEGTETPSCTTGTPIRADTPSFTGTLSYTDMPSCTGMPVCTDTPSCAGTLSYTDTPICTNTPSCAGTLSYTDTPISRVADSIRVLRAINACAATAIPLVAPLFSNPHVYYYPWRGGEGGGGAHAYVAMVNPAHGVDLLCYLRGKRFLLKQTTDELWSKGFFCAKAQNYGAPFTSKPYFSIRVDRTLVDGTLRNSLLSQSVPQILSCDPSMLLSDATQKPFMVVFKGERSTDFGGPFHEFLSSLAAELSLLSSDAGEGALMEQCPNLANAQGGYQDTLLFKYTPRSASVPIRGSGLPCDVLDVPGGPVSALSCWFGCCDLPSCRSLTVLDGCGGAVQEAPACRCGGSEARNAPCGIPLPEELRVYEALGRICGMCASMGIPFGVFFNPMVWKKLVFDTLRGEDIALFDEATLSHISMLSQGDLRDLRFEVGESSSPNGLADLLPDGHEIPVTCENVGDYVDLLKLYKINQGNIGLTWFSKGFAAVLPLGYIRLMLESGVVEYMVCGDPEIDLDVLKGHTCSSNSGLLNEFFGIISEFTNDQLKLLLRFVSGRSRLPPAHYTDWKFRIEYEADMPNADARLPTSATCNFRLLVPRYSSAEIFRDRLLYAASNCIAIDLDV